MTSDTPGLATAVQIEALADQLSVIADEIHARVVHDIKRHQGPFTEAEQDIVHALLEDEVQLRQRAGGLYADAATYVVQSLGASQQQIVKLTADAAEKIRKMSRLADITALVGGVLMFAGAAASGQPAPIVKAIEQLSKRVQAVKASAPGKTA
jgi:hypothetical protein